GPPSGRRGQGVLRAAESARRPGARELRFLPARDPHSPQGAEGRLAFVRAELLPPLPPGGAARRAGRHVHKPRRLSLRGARLSGFRVEDDEVVLPEAFEKLAAALVAHPGAAQNLASGALAVDPPENP